MFTRLSLLILLLPGTVFALDLKGHQFTDSYRYSLLEDTSVERFRGTNIFLGSYAFVRSPFYTTNENVSKVTKDIIKYNNVLTLGYSHYVNDALTLGIDGVAVQNKVLDESYLSMGDTNLRAKYLLTDRGNHYGLSLNPFITLPSGKKENFTTARSVTGGVRAVLEKAIESWHFLGSLGYSHAPENKYKIVDQRNLLLTQLGVSYDITSDWNANFEVVRNFTLSSDNRQDEGDYYLTLKDKMSERLSLYGGAGLAGAEKAERRQYTLFIGFKWSDANPPAPVVVKAPVQPPVKKEAPVVVAQPKVRSQEAQFGSLFETDNIYFENGRSSVTPVEREKVLKIVRVYKKIGKFLSKIVIEGYASTRGNPVANELLSQKRTQAVLLLLQSEGVPAALMTTVGYGDNAIQDPEEWKNRKVQFRLYRKKQ